MALKTRTSLNVSRRGERGFTMVQMVVTVVIVAIVTTFAVVQIASARDQMRLTGATREFAGYTEKARLDSIRRHGSFGGGDSKVTLNSANGYTLLFDADYNGTPANRTFMLPEGVTISEVIVTSSASTVTQVPSAGAPVEITFDWHGRTANAYRIKFVNTR